MPSVTGLAVAEVAVADAAAARPAAFVIHQGLTVFSLEVCHIILVQTLSSATLTLLLGPLQCVRVCSWRVLAC